MSKLQREIKQARPFRSVEQEAFLNLQKTADALMQGVAETLKPFGVSPTQYNVLRILYGAAEGLSCREIGERMITRDPDVTRLLDRLEERDLVKRHRDRADRRIVLVEITAEGNELVEATDEPVARLLKNQLGHVGQARLNQLVELLEAIRT